MWQTKNALAVPKNLGLGLNFWPCSEGYFLSGRPQSVSISINFHYSGPQKAQLVDPEFKIQVTREVQNIQTRVGTPCNITNSKTQVKTHLDPKWTPFKESFLPCFQTSLLYFLHLLSNQLQFNDRYWIKKDRLRNMHESIYLIAPYHSKFFIMSTEFDKNISD